MAIDGPLAVAIAGVLSERFEKVTTPLDEWKFDKGRADDLINRRAALRISKEEDTIDGVKCSRLDFEAATKTNLLDGNFIVVGHLWIDATDSIRLLRSEVDTGEKREITARSDYSSDGIPRKWNTSEYRGENLVKQIHGVVTEYSPMTPELEDSVFRIQPSPKAIIEKVDTSLKRNVINRKNVIYPNDCLSAHPSRSSATFVRIIGGSAF